MKHQAHTHDSTAPRPYRTLQDIDCKGKTVLLRADLNVPVARAADGSVRVTEASRLRALLPSLKALRAAGARIVLLSHFGRPKGGPDAENSLRPIAPALAAVLGVPVAFAEDCIGPAAQAAIETLAPGGVVLLENLRFHAGEEKNDPDFARALAGLGDIYVNDAFSVSHRAHASTAGLPALRPSAAGEAMRQELEALALALESPRRPVLALVGGAKISTKLELLGNLVRKVNVLALGGGMANTFLAARGLNLGRSLVEADMLETARAIETAARDAGCTILLPVDGLAATEFSEKAGPRTLDVTAVPPDHMLLDIGPRSVAALEAAIHAARTLVWNGPLGAFELSAFAGGTCAVAQAAARATQAGALKTVAGGGDTLAALSLAGVTEEFSYVSTAGGAFLEWLEGKTLPGVEALSI